MEIKDLENLNRYEAFELIKRRRLQLSLHSTVYYVYNMNLISDSEYDRFSEELVKLQKYYPEVSKDAPLYEEFKDWDGSTGFHLSDRVKDVHHKALRMIRLKEGR